MEQQSKKQLAAWLGGIVMVAGAAFGALSLGGKTSSVAQTEPAVVAVSGQADADAARAERRARLDAMRERLDALEDRVEALPEKPDPVATKPGKPGKPKKPVKPVKPPADDDGPGPVVIDPACLANPLCIKG